jgi:ribosome biogenesis GTPase A
MNAQISRVDPDTDAMTLPNVRSLSIGPTPVTNKSPSKYNEPRSTDVQIKNEDGDGSRLNENRMRETSIAGPSNWSEQPISQNQTPLLTNALIEQKTPITLNILAKLISENSPEMLEDGVKVGMNILHSLLPPLESIANSPDGNHTTAGAWLKRIHDIQDRSIPARTVVGVVGNTGAGKSSVINALLDEER